MTGGCPFPRLPERGHLRSFPVGSVPLAQRLRKAAAPSLAGSGCPGHADLLVTRELGFKPALLLL